MQASVCSVVLPASSDTQSKLSKVSTANPAGLHPSYYRLQTQVYLRSYPSPWKGWLQQDSQQPAMCWKIGNDQCHCLTFLSVLGLLQFLIGTPITVLSFLLLFWTDLGYLLSPFWCGISVSAVCFFSFCVVFNYSMCTLPAKARANKLCCCSK